MSSPPNSDAGTRLHSDALAWFQAAAAAEPPRAADYAVNGACLVSVLPAEMTAEALRWLPGQGLPNALRMTIGTEDETRGLAAAIRGALNG